MRETGYRQSVRIRLGLGLGLGLDKVYGYRPVIDPTSSHALSASHFEDGGERIRFSPLTAVNRFAESFRLIGFSINRTEICNMTSVLEKAFSRETRLELYKNYQKAVFTFKQ
jgi:hypothetical protein